MKFLKKSKLCLGAGATVSGTVLYPPITHEQISSLSTSNISAKSSNVASESFKAGETIAVAIQSTDKLVSSTSGRRYMVYGPFDAKKVESVTCQLNNEVKARLEMAISGQSKTVDGAEITNCIGFGKTYTDTLSIRACLETIFSVTRTTTIKGKTTQEIGYYIRGLECKLENLLASLTLES